MICSQCQMQNPEDAVYCANCGFPLSQRCSNCHAEVKPGARFCMYCGQAIHPQTPADNAIHSRLAASVPAPLAEKVLTTALVSERRVVTILFADVVGSTALADRLDVETWGEVMNGAFDLITPTIYRFEGTIARLLGDSLIAFFGAPLAHEDDPRRAILTALESAELMRNYAQMVSDRYGVEFSMRFCLNTGPVIINSVGQDLKYDYTATGGAVNLAARLKFAAPPMEVVVSDNTYRFSAPYFDFVDLGLIETKDRAEPVRVYQVIGSRRAPGSLRGLVGLESPLVGRQDELSVLMSLCDAVCSGVGRSVLILGEPGLGKTRLIAEWQSLITQIHCDTLPQWAEGRCLSYGKTMAYNLVLDLLRSLLGLSMTASQAELQWTLSSVISDLFQDNTSSTKSDVETYLAHLLGLPLDKDSAAQVSLLDPQALQAQYTMAMRNFLLALASHRPVVIVLEDLHWADPSSIEMLIRALPLVFNVPLLFCLVSRMERDSEGWKLIQAAREQLGSSLVEMTLNALSNDESRELIANLLAIENLPENLRSLIMEKSEGNPFFVEEVIRMLIENNAIVRLENGWGAGKELEKIQVPDNLEGLLIARIDRLSEESKNALRVASVVGRRFPIKILQQILSDNQIKSKADPAGTMGTLNSLESAGLIRIAQIQPDLEYLFRHSLVQDAAYASILHSDRIRLHRMVGETIEKLYPEKLKSRELAPRLAVHFSVAGDDDRALKYYQLAGQAALDSYANQEAEGYFRQALLLACTENERAELMINYGEALTRLGQDSAAISAWREAIDYFLTTKEIDQVAHLYARAGRAAWWGANTPLSLELCQEGMRAISEAPESVGVAVLIHETARAYYFNGVPDRAKLLCEQALAMADHLGAVDVQADALATYGVILRDNPGESIQALEKAVELADTHNLLITALRAYQNLGTMKKTFYGENNTACQHYQRAVEIAHQRGVPQEEFFTLSSLAFTYMDMGELHLADKLQVQMRELLPFLSDPGSATMEIDLLDSLRKGLRGDWSAAIENVRRLQDINRQRGNLQNLVGNSEALAQFTYEYASFGHPVDWREAESALQEVVDLSHRGLGLFTGAYSWLCLINTFQGKLERAHHFYDQAKKQAEKERASIWSGINLLIAEHSLAKAEAHWEDAIAICEKCVGIIAPLNQPFMHARLLTELADSLTSRGEPADLEQAHDIYQHTLDLYQNIGAQRYYEREDHKRNILRERILAQAVAQKEVSREMAQARQVQLSFLPENPPHIPGWDLAARLIPARETSGDYYDFISLPDRKLGIVIADVADKGAGAALFMASSQTLVRTFAAQHPNQIAKVVELVNRRLLTDTRSGLFVSIFYAVLDPQTGELTYCNAGHNPPMVIGPSTRKVTSTLSATGMVVGVSEEASWTEKTILMQPGELLVMFTDGVTEAQNKAGDYYGDAGLKDSLESTLIGQDMPNVSAHLVLESAFRDMQMFLGDQHLRDDTTIMVLLHNG